MRPAADGPFPWTDRSSPFPWTRSSPRSGQYSDTKLLSGAPGLVDEKGNLKADLDTGRTEVPGVFAAGDLLTGTDIAIRAIAGGKHAARAALAYMEGRTYQRPKEFLSRKADFKEPVAADFTDTPRAPRARPAVMEPERRKRNFAEIESTLPVEAARAEAERCLECGCQDVRDCALKQHATEYDAVAKRFLGEVAIHPIDDSHPFISRDPSKCVLCGRCIRICLDVQGIGVFGYIYRGFASVVAPSFGVPFGEDTDLHLLRPVRLRVPRGRAHGEAPGKKERAAAGEDRGRDLHAAARWAAASTTAGTAASSRESPSATRLPNNGKLCKKGKFGHEFLNDPVPAAVDLHEARRHGWARALAKARSPVMRISPYLSGEAIDAFVEAAARRGIPVRAAGLENVDPRWAQLASGSAAGCTEDSRQLILLIGDIGAIEQRRVHRGLSPAAQGRGRPVDCSGTTTRRPRRAASRVIADVQAALSEALATGAAGRSMGEPRGSAGRMRWMPAARAREGGCPAALELPKRGLPLHASDAADNGKLRTSSWTSESRKRPTAPGGSPGEESRAMRTCSSPCRASCGSWAARTRRGCRARAAARSTWKP